MKEHFMNPVARRPIRVFLLTSFFSCASLGLFAQNGPAYGRSIDWQQARAPFTPDPGAGAIEGGPGNDPNPGAPMYVCRAQFQGSMVPGKWVQGSCNVAFGNAEHIMPRYQVAYGTARWGRYRGDTNGLVQTGSEPDGSPLYSCRVHYFGGIMNTDYGYQPGKLVGDGTCHIPVGGAEIVQSPPFQVLYGAGGGRPPYPIPYPPYPYPPQPPDQPLPGCRLSDPGVVLDTNTGHWEGPDCSPSDGLGHITGPPKYPDQNQYPYSPPPDQGQYQAPPPPYQPGPSSVRWQPAQNPFQPSQGAIEGGPGNGPKPGAPLYICRASYNNSLYPGKWIQGQCSIADGTGHEQKVDSYQVASGNAAWRAFDGNIGALVPGGFDADGTPLYICRKKLNYWGNKGLQPGWLENGECHIPYGGMDNVSGPSFEALYNVFSASSSPAGQQQSQPPPQASQPVTPDAVVANETAAQSHGILITFMNGTGATAGTATVTNGATGQSIAKPLPASSTPQQCVSVLQQAAFEAGLQIQAQPDGKGLRVYGINNSVHVTGATMAVSQF
jgi:hypothetical protein